MEEDARGPGWAVSLMNSCRCTPGPGVAGRLSLEPGSLSPALSEHSGAGSGGLQLRSPAPLSDHGPQVSPEWPGPQKAFELQWGNWTGSPSWTSERRAPALLADRDPPHPLGSRLWSGRRPVFCVTWVSRCRLLGPTRACPRSVHSCALGEGWGSCPWLEGSAPWSDLVSGGMSPRPRSAPQDSRPNTLPPLRALGPLLRRRGPQGRAAAPGASPGDCPPSVPSADLR